jgi:hypothetical protein
MFKDGQRTRQDIVIPVSHDTKAARREIVISARVCFALIVLPAVSFDNQATFETHKIHDPRSNGHLATKLGICEPTPAQKSPQRLLRSRGPLTERLRKFSLLI